MDYIFGMKRNLIICTIIFLTSLFAQTNVYNLEKKQNTGISGEDYISGEDGIVRIYVNIWGHIKDPGTYLIFDGADLINALSIAGGPLDGANLKNVTIASKDSGELISYNLKNDFLNGSVRLKPYDTILVQQSVSDRILDRSSLISAIFQLINLVYTIDRLD